MPIDTTTYFNLRIYWLIPILLLTYSVCITIFTDIEWVFKMKRIYYSICTLFYIFMLKNINLIGISVEKGLFGTSNKVWSIIVFTIIFFLTSIIIDNWIISGYVFKEFGFFGAKFIKDETKITVVEQEDYIHSLENGIKGEFDVIDDVKKLFADGEVIGDIRTDNFDLIERFSEILRLYYKHRKVSVDVECQVYLRDNIDNIVDELIDDNQLQLYKKHQIKRTLNKNETLYIENKKQNLLLVTTKSSVLNDESNLLIKVKSIKDINLYDRHIIVNILFYFELYLVLALKKIQSQAPNNSI